MSFESIILNASIIITAVTAISIFFGKIISESKVEIFTKTDLIISGSLFSIIFLILPLSIIYQNFHTNTLDLPLFIYILIPILIMGILNHSINWHKISLQFKSLDKFEKSYNEKLKDLSKNDSLKNFLPKGSIGFEISKAVFNFLDKTLKNNLTLLIFSTIIVFFCFQVWTLDFQIGLKTFLFILFALALSVIAIAYGQKDVKVVKSDITLNDGKTLKVYIVKHGDFILAYDDKNKYLLNKNSIKYIKQPKFLKNN